MSGERDGKEQRRSVRNRLRRRVRVDPGAIQALTGDLSIDGAFILTSRLPREGMRVRLTFTAKGTEVSAEALVRWVRSRTDVSQGLKPVGVGIEFVKPLFRVQPLT